MTGHGESLLSVLERTRGLDCVRLEARQRRRILRHQIAPKRASSYLVGQHAIDAERSVTFGSGVLEALARHIDIAPSLIESGSILKEHVVSAIIRARVHTFNPDDGDVVLPVNIGEICGLQRCVPTGPTDHCFWAPYLSSDGAPHRGNHGKVVLRRFVEGREALPTSLVTIVFRVSYRRLLILAAYYGEPSRKIPGTTGASQDDRRWWYDQRTGCGHAFVYEPGNLRVLVDKDPARRIVKCPW